MASRMNYCPFLVVKGSSEITLNRFPIDMAFRLLQLSTLNQTILLIDEMTKSATI